MGDNWMPALTAIRARLAQINHWKDVLTEELRELDITERVLVRMAAPPVARGDEGTEVTKPEGSCGGSS